MSPFRTLVLLSLCLVVGLAGAQEGGDLQAQILYAFHAEDANQLASLIQTLTTQEQAGSADAALRYHLAHAEYRAGLLAAQRSPTAATALGRATDADKAFSACIDQLKVLLEQDPDSVESLALTSACYSNLAGARKLEAALLRSRAADRMRRAAKLDPHNPRVVYLSALDGLSRSASGTMENARAFAELQLAAQLFEQSSATRDDVPGWGHPEAYLELGKQLEARGDVLGARNWIEKSLIAAPDFTAAQRQLAALIRH